MHIASSKIVISGPEDQLKPPAARHLQGAYP